MSEQVETQKVLDELSRSNHARAGGLNGRQKRTAARRVVILLAMLAPVLAALALLAFLQWNLRADLRELYAENQRLIDIINSDSSRFAQLETQLAEQSRNQADGGASVRQLEAELNQEIQRLNRTITDLQEQLATREPADTGTWRRAEAAYLLRIAGERVQLEQDSATAMELLSSADRILSEQSGDGIRAVREAISREINLLNALPQIDREVIYLRMAGLMDSLDSLPLRSISSADFSARLPAPDATGLVPGDRSSGVLQPALNLLSSVFVWRRWDEAPDVMLPDLQPGTALLGMRLLLEQAQLGLIKRQEAVYQESLSRCRDLLHQYADMASVQAQSFESELLHLRTLTINPELPDISQSLTLLQQLRD